MNSCTKCGNPVDAGATFCPKCDPMPQQWTQDQTPRLPTQQFGQQDQQGWGPQQQFGQQSGWGQPQQMQPQRHVTPHKEHLVTGLGLAGLTFIALNFYWPYVHFIGLAFGIATLVFSILGLRKQDKPNNSIMMTGIILGILSIVGFLIMCLVNHFVFEVPWWF